MEYDKIIKQYTQQLRRFFASRVRNISDADDLVQEVFYKTLRRSRTIKDPSKFRSWLFSVARNALVDHYRSSAKYVNDEMGMVEKVLEESEEIKQELSECIQPFLKNLPGKYRHILEEVELRNIPQKKLASELGMSYSALKSRVQRGRDLLLSLFRQCCEYQTDARGGIVDFKKVGQHCGTCE